MSNGDQAGEPSMDEILSSIRKIIADDEVDPPQAATPAAHDAGGDDADHDLVDVAAADDILELTEADQRADDAASPAHIFDDEGDLSAAADALGDASLDAFTIDEEASSGDDDLDMSEAELEERDPQAPPGEGDDGFATVIEMPADGALADTARRAAAAADAASIDEMADVLLDTGAATAAGGALRRLSSAVAPGEAIPQGARSIEAFLADLVRPELKAWLDQHLPGLVERIVEREIKRLVRDAQPE